MRLEHLWETILAVRLEGVIVDVDCDYVLEEGYVTVAVPALLGELLPGMGRRVVVLVLPEEPPTETAQEG